ncbi:MAG: FtsW/RodA/SpoVE family cell cycle protein, partial [Candidatus Eremiobacteraeota bacterium]|nr:FtsW/RodA/SpoVE family cell cycle protein [Candidatus Eremiobacteraeota bacterium]
MATLSVSGRRWLRNFNWPLAIAPVFLTMLGILMIQSADLHATSAAAEYKKQALYAVMGVCLMMGFSYIDYRNWRRWAYITYGINLALLAFILRGGHHALGAVRWISLGPLGTFQPSE